jgi:hypothetical protein
VLNSLRPALQHLSIGLFQIGLFMGSGLVYPEQLLEGARPPTDGEPLSAAEYVAWTELTTALRTHVPERGSWVARMRGDR